MRPAPVRGSVRCLGAIATVDVNAIHGRAGPAADRGDAASQANDGRVSILALLLRDLVGLGPGGHAVLGSHALRQPRVPQAAAVTQPLTGIEREQPSREALRLLGDAAESRVHPHLFHQDLLGICRIVVHVEGKFAAEHHVVDNTEAPEVDALVVGLLHDLGGEVVWRAARRHGLSDDIQPCRQAKVRDHHVVEEARRLALGPQRLLDQDVISLQVAVEDSALMHAGQAVHELAHHVHGGALRAQRVLANTNVVLDLLPQVALAC
mmetsp:Transcript_1221/g.3080  ORF Transcript_1221/g.3080 Transcript_1221/m.3080 type:complete len:265 (-) Transcript_1221:365-1159(-)